MLPPPQDEPVTPQTRPRGCRSLPQSAGPAGDEPPAGGMRPRERRGRAVVSPRCCPGAVSGAPGEGRGAEQEKDWDPEKEREPEPPPPLPRQRRAPAT